MYKEQKVGVKMETKFSMYAVINAEGKSLHKDENGHYGFYHFYPGALTMHKVDATHLYYDAKKELEGIRELKEGDVMNPYGHKYNPHFEVKEFEVITNIK